MSPSLYYKFIGYMHVNKLGQEGFFFISVHAVVQGVVCHLANFGILEDFGILK